MSEIQIAKANSRAGFHLCIKIRVLGKYGLWVKYVQQLKLTFEITMSV